jgi:hypothetical protein
MQLGLGLIAYLAQSCMDIAVVADPRARHVLKRSALQRCLQAQLFSTNHHRRRSALSPTAQFETAQRRVRLGPGAVPEGHVLQQP